MLLFHTYTIVAIVQLISMSVNSILPFVMM